MRKYVLAALAAVLIVPASASAQGLPGGGIGFARTIGKAHISKNGRQAVLTVRYSCAAGGDHLWVSLKQSASGRRDPAIRKEGSGGGHVSASWLDSHREVATCDGRRRTAQFYVDQAEPGKYGHLRRGFAWLQFCVTNSTLPEAQSLVTYLPTWVRVR
jgi:hypothetical protein